MARSRSGPTGWSDAAIRTIAERSYGRAFHDPRLGVALFDLHADDDQLDHTDQRLWAFWPLLAPVRFEREVSRCVGVLGELAEKLESISLTYAAKLCGADVTWVRAAFEELKRTGKYVLEKLPEVGLVLLRRGL